MSLPRVTRQAALDVDEILAFLRQSNISARNLERLRILSESSEEEVARLARLVREVAMICPHKRKRLTFLAKEHKALFERLRELELLDMMQPY